MIDTAPAKTIKFVNSISCLVSVQFQSGLRHLVWNNEIIIRSQNLSKIPLEQLRNHSSGLRLGVSMVFTAAGKSYNGASQEASHNSP